MLAALGRLRGWVRELQLLVASLAAYALSSGSLLRGPSQAPHFIYQAQAFLHGQLHLTRPPPDLNDWVFQSGRWYVSFPPFPAVLMMPWVAIWGFATNDVAFTLVFTALNVPLLYALLRRLEADGERTGGQVGWLFHALLFGFGTLAWSCGIRGEVWFTAETVGVSLTLLYLHASLRARAPAWAGLALACATITRTPLIFSGLFFVLEVLAPGPGPLWAQIAQTLRSPSWRPVALRKLLMFTLPMVLVGAPMALMNWVRFGDPLEFGHRHLFQNRVNAQIAKYGLFHYQYLERNLHAAFTRLPTLAFHPFRIGFDGEGMSLLVTTPLFVLLLWPAVRGRLHSRLWLAAAAVALPGFFYQNSGYYQFGFRFSLDYTPYLVVLLALGQRSLSRLGLALAAASVAVNAWGAAVFQRPS